MTVVFLFSLLLFFFSNLVYIAHQTASHRISTICNNFDITDDTSNSISYVCSSNVILPTFNLCEFPYISYFLVAEDISISWISADIYFIANQNRSLLKKCNEIQPSTAELFKCLDFYAIWQQSFFTVNPLPITATIEHHFTAINISNISGIEIGYFDIDCYSISYPPIHPQKKHTKIQTYKTCTLPFLCFLH